VIVGVHRLRAGHLLGIEKFRPSTQTSASASRGNSCQRALADEIPLELGKRREDVKHELADPGRGVDVLLQAASTSDSDVARFE
jgi:hypothetical protein